MVRYITCAASRQDGEGEIEREKQVREEKRKRNKKRGCSVHHGDVCAETGV